MSAPVTPGVSCTWYPDCAQGVEVGLCTHDGGHDWPTGTSTAIWAFFESAGMVRNVRETDGYTLASMGNKLGCSAQF